MKRCPNSRILAIVATLCLSLIAVSAFAQIQTGNIFGKAQAKDGSLLPGVTVTLTGVGAPQVAVTDGQGNFRFLSLSPGQYTIKGELSGYGTATRTGVASYVRAASPLSLRRASTASAPCSINAANVSTTTGSNCEPAHLRSSTSASLTSTPAW